MTPETIFWMDGTIDENGIPGILLSDNVGYFGPVISTGCTYSYEQGNPRQGADSDEDTSCHAGRHLLNGLVRNRYVSSPCFPEGRVHLLVDLRIPVCVVEFDLLTDDVPDLRIDISTSDDDAAYSPVSMEMIHPSSSKAFDRYPFNSITEISRIRIHRVAVRTSGACRFLRVEICSPDGSPFSLEQFYVWGKPAGNAAKMPRADSASLVGVANSVTVQSIPGVTSSVFSDYSGFLWRRAHGDTADCAVWQVLPTYGPVTDKPLLPSPSKLRVHPLRMLREEILPICLSLTNLDIFHRQALRVSVRLKESVPSPIPTLSVFGIVASRWYGTGIGPILNDRDTIDPALFPRYLTNAEQVAGFPILTLDPAASAILWLKLDSRGAAPGLYHVQVLAEPVGTSASSAVEQVFDVEIGTEALPHIPLWMDACTFYTEMVPFTLPGRIQNELAYMNEMGISTHRGWPWPGSASEEAVRTNPDTQLVIWGMGRFVDLIYGGRLKPEDVDDSVRDELAGILDELQRTAGSFGLENHQWYIETADEPNAGNVAVLAKMVELAKRLRPDVRTYVNPAFWTGWENGATSSDDVLHETLRGWYEKTVDISTPLLLNLIDRPKSFAQFSAPRETNALYSIIGQHARSERPENSSLSRDLAWQALSRGFNGWCYYAYFRPEADAWNDSDEMIWKGLPDYQVVYPGLNGPIATRASEASRDGHQDYRRMKLLESVDRSAFLSILDQYRNGEHDFEKLRRLSVDALFQHRPSPIGEDA